MGDEPTPAEPISDAPDSQPTAVPAARRRRSLPVGRNASPWSRRLVLAVVIVVVIAAPLWIDPLTLATFGGSRASGSPIAPPSESTDAIDVRPVATDDPSLVWSTAVDQDTVFVDAWAAISAGTLEGATAPGVMAHNTQIALTFSAPDSADGPAEVGALLRRTSDGTAYFAAANVATDGTLSLVVELVDGSQVRELAVPVALAGVTVAATDQLRIRAEVTGIDPSTIKLRVWPASLSEPRTWQMSVIDWTGVLQHSGELGVAWSIPTTGSAPTITSFQALTADEGTQP